MTRWPTAPLTTRELEVLLWAARGKTYANTAAILGLSWATVKVYLDAARHKLGAANMPQACAMAVAGGLITRKEVFKGPPFIASSSKSLHPPYPSPPPANNQ